MHKSFARSAWHFHRKRLAFFTLGLLLFSVSFHIQNAHFAGSRPPVCTSIEVLVAASRLLCYRTCQRVKESRIFWLLPTRFFVGHFLCGALARSVRFADHSWCAVIAWCTIMEERRCRDCTAAHQDFPNKLHARSHRSPTDYASGATRRAARDGGVSSPEHSQRWGRTSHGRSAKRGQKMLALLTFLACKSLVMNS
jgi:hypothetical protein